METLIQAISSEFEIVKLTSCHVVTYPPCVIFKQGDTYVIQYRQKTYRTKKISEFIQQLNRFKNDYIILNRNSANS